MSSSYKKIKTEDLDEYMEGEGPGGHGLVGFAFTKEGKRVKTYYGSANERAFCECSELCDQGLFVEAWEKLGEYEATCTYKPNAKLQARVLVGYNKVLADSGQKDKKKAFEDAMQGHRMAAYQDSGTDQDEIVEAMCGTVEAYLKQIIPNSKDSDGNEKSYYAPDYDSAGVDSLLEAAEAWFAAVAMFEDGYGGSVMTETTEDAHEGLYGIVGALAGKGAFQQAKATAEKMMKADPTMKRYSKHYEAIFQAYVAECAEVMGDKGGAHKAYASIPKLDDDGLYDENEGESMIGDKCPSGTLDERLARTQT